MQYSFVFSSVDYYPFDMPMPARWGMDHQLDSPVVCTYGTESVLVPVWVNTPVTLSPAVIGNAILQIVQAAHRAILTVDSSAEGFSQPMAVSPDSSYVLSFSALSVSGASFLTTVTEGSANTILARAVVSSDGAYTLSLVFYKGMLL